MKLRWKMTVVGVIVVAFCAYLLLRSDNSAKMAVEKTRRVLHQQGFKTDLAEFDFSTSAELRAREAVLTATAPDRYSKPFHDHPTLMTAVGLDSAIVVWKQDWVKGQYAELSWPEFREALNVNRTLWTPYVKRRCPVPSASP